MNTVDMLANMVKAAQAAGYNVEAVGINDLYISTNHSQNEKFNPYEEDGAAFRLAADMQFTVQIGRLDGTVVVTSNNYSSVYSSEMWKPGEPSYNAIRSAIVGAAVQVWSFRSEY